jgi:hypothetical protein
MGLKHELTKLRVEIPSNSIKYVKIGFIDIQVLEILIVQNYDFPQNSINIYFHFFSILQIFPGKF